MFNTEKQMSLISKAEALPGREQSVALSDRHCVLNNPLKEDFNPPLQKIVFAMGCFWGAERLFWKQQGIYTTAVGYAGGYTPNPTYEEVCTGQTAHTEVVLVVYDPQKNSLFELLKLFWQSHDPTQGMRQGNDRGTQYRSAIYTYGEQDYQLALETKEHYQSVLNAAHFAGITTEIKQDQSFYYAEDYHQQYLFKNPYGYCGLQGTGVNY